ncbi:MAG: extracellular solute-binding protein [Candidatus Magnetoglobus multicellularis str. Araruama]|uniref:Extracellular solute-binding protein n=1 Tax=Candidatus Magnetoglobus multicellularis str. Araruama TaxID=890399 RepID=A0A1V1PAV2_9BACT|nr:MAG: extracellular solute-binding protein [Candidatus Magnetoglobus multicellularis str. Araruama]
MKKSLLLAFVLVLTNCISAFSGEFMLEADYRQRPPEMVIDENTGDFSGPLIDIMNMAAAEVGLTVKWQQNYFKRSYSRLIRGNVDIVPRVIIKKERKEFVKYFNPIGYQQKNIVFIVQKGKESLIQKYEDLYNISVGVKKGTVYFKRFDSDSRIDKRMSVDDKNMSMMFAAKRFDAMIILDIPAFEKALKNIGFDNYAYAEYKHVQVISNQYAMSKKSSKIKLFDRINSAFRDLVKHGKIRQCYQKYNLPPLLNENDIVGMDLSHDNLSD